MAQFDDKLLLSVIRTKSFQIEDGNDSHEQSVKSLIAKIYSSWQAPNLTALAPTFKIF